MRVAGRRAKRPQPWSTSRKDANMSKPTCSIEGCPRPAKARGWCNTHAMRFYKQREITPDPSHCPNCGLPLVVDYDGGPGYPTLTHRTEAEYEQCAAVDVKS